MLLRHRYHRPTVQGDALCVRGPCLCLRPRLLCLRPRLLCLRRRPSRDAGVQLPRPALHPRPLSAPQPADAHPRPTQCLCLCLCLCLRRRKCGCGRAGVRRLGLGLGLRQPRHRTMRHLQLRSTRPAPRWRHSQRQQLRAPRHPGGGDRPLHRLPTLCLCLCLYLRLCPCLCPCPRLRLCLYQHQSLCLCYGPGHGQREDAIRGLRLLLPRIKTQRQLRLLETHHPRLCLCLCLCLCLWISPCLHLWRSRPHLRRIRDGPTLRPHRASRSPCRRCAPGQPVCGRALLLPLLPWLLLLWRLLMLMLLQPPWLCMRTLPPPRSRKCCRWLGWRRLKRSTLLASRTTRLTRCPAPRLCPHPRPTLRQRQCQCQRPPLCLLRQ
jgi:hypothetical protein